MATGFWRGAERASETALNTGMALLNRSDRLAHQKETMGMQSEYLDMAKENHAINQRAAQQKAEQEAHQAELLPIGETLSKLGIKRPAVQNAFIQYAGPLVETGAASGLPVISRKNANEIWAKMQGDANFNIEVDTINAQEAQKELRALDAQMQEMGDKLKPEQVEQYQAKRQALVGEIAAADNSIKRLQGLDVYKKKIELDTPTLKKALNPETGKEEFFYIDDKRNIVFTGAQPVNKGMTIESDGQGGFTINTNAVQGGVTKPVQTEIQKTLIEQREAVQLVGNAISKYQYKYQTLPFRLQSGFESVKQRLGKKPDPEMSKQLTEFKSWYKTAMRDYAIAIQKLGKGNLTKNEQKLYGAGLPDPGDGIWPKDAPEVYFNALTDRYKKLNASIARLNYYMQGGLSHEQTIKLIGENKVISLDQMDEIINKRVEELKKEQPDIELGEVINQVKAEFGLK